ncbi:hypothetical protein DMA11_15355 [Marinilabiliaceae bacterium JC017]|nr:hypothetical protein DMA11_15355 [Marinilabiliaceae bacterium JC017]
MSKLTSIFLFIFLPFFQFINSQNSDNSLDIEDEIIHLLSEIKKDTDRVKLWKKEILGPTLFINRTTKKAYCNYKLNNAFKRVRDELYSGQLPDDIIVANSTAQINGINCAMIALPLPSSISSKKTLVIHESFHRIQDSVIQNHAYYNEHIDNKDARILLKLEWEYLIRAYTEKDKNTKTEYCHKALDYRAQRRKIYPECAKNENYFELEEGLAEYTAVKYCFRTRTEIADYLNNQWTKFKPAQSFIRTFGYLSGLSYALLLDDYNTEWRLNSNEIEDLGALLLKHLPMAQYESMSNSNDTLYHRITQEENNIYQQRQQFLNSIITKLDTAKFLIFELTENKSIGFNPSDMHDLDSLGTYFPFIEVKDNWGTVKVKRGNGALISDNWSILKVIQGDNLEMNLSNAWRFYIDTEGNKVLKQTSH